MELPICHTTLITRMRFQTREKTVWRRISSTLGTIIVDDMETTYSLDQTTLFKILKDLLDDEIKPVLHAQFTVIQKMFNQEIESHISKTQLILSKSRERQLTRPSIK